MSWEAVWRGHFVRGAIQKVSLCPPFQLATQRKHVFFLIRRQKLEYQVFVWRSLYWSKFIAYVVVVEWGSQIVGRPRSAPGDLVITTTHFHPLPKIAFLS